MIQISSRHILASLAFFALLPACLGPAVDDEPGYSTALLGKKAKVPRVEDSMPLMMRIDGADGINGPVVALRSGMLDGSEVRYWDFGTAVSSAEPVYQFRRKGAHGVAEAIGHLDLVDSAPGDNNYSPFRQIYTVYVTDAYDGELITTLQALDDAIELGLCEEAKRTTTYVNWPMALADAQLEQGDAMPMMAPQAIYYRGRIATYFDPGGSYVGQGRFEVEKEPIATPSVYLLRRQNETKPIDEAAAHVDFNADGDMNDSNTVFTLGVDAPGYTSIWRQVDVTVAADYVWASARSEADLFERSDSGGLTALAGVIEYQESMMLLNRVLQRSAP
jgi:hypothetical protein